MTCFRQPEFFDWGFNLPRGQSCLDKWNLIPDDTDVLVTHGPPIGKPAFQYLIREVITTFELI